MSWTEAEVKRLFADVRGKKLLTARLGTVDRLKVVLGESSPRVRKLTTDGLLDLVVDAQEPADVRARCADVLEAELRDEDFREWSMDWPVGWTERLSAILDEAALSAALRLLAARALATRSLEDPRLAPKIAGLFARQLAEPSNAIGLRLSCLEHLAESQRGNPDWLIELRADGSLAYQALPGNWASLDHDAKTVTAVLADPALLTDLDAIEIHARYDHSAARTLSRAVTAPKTHATLLRLAVEYARAKSVLDLAWVEEAIAHAMMRAAVLAVKAGTRCDVEEHLRLWHDLFRDGGRGLTNRLLAIVRTAKTFDATLWSAWVALHAIQSQTDEADRLAFAQLDRATAAQLDAAQLDVLLAQVAPDRVLALQESRKLASIDIPTRAQYEQVYRHELATLPRRIRLTRLEAILREGTDIDRLGIALELLPHVVAWLPSEVDRFEPLARAHVTSERSVIAQHQRKLPPTHPQAIGRLAFESCVASLLQAGRPASLDLAKAALDAGHDSTGLARLASPELRSFWRGEVTATGIREQETGNRKVESESERTGNRQQATGNSQRESERGRTGGERAGSGARTSGAGAGGERAGFGAGIGGGRGAGDLGAPSAQAHVREPGDRRLRGAGAEREAEPRNQIRLSAWRAFEASGDDDVGALAEEVLALGMPDGELGVVLVDAVYRRGPARLARLRLRGRVPSIEELGVELRPARAVAALVGVNAVVAHLEVGEPLGTALGAIALARHLDDPAIVRALAKRVRDPRALEEHSVGKSALLVLLELAPDVALDEMLAVVGDPRLSDLARVLTATFADVAPADLREKAAPRLAAAFHRAIQNPTRDLELVERLFDVYRPADLGAIWRDARASSAARFVALKRLHSDEAISEALTIFFGKGDSGLRALLGSVLTIWRPDAFTNVVDMNVQPWRALEQRDLPANSLPANMPDSWLVATLALARHDDPIQRAAMELRNRLTPQREHEWPRIKNRWVELVGTHEAAVRGNLRQTLTPHTACLLALFGNQEDEPTLANVAGQGWVEAMPAGMNVFWRPADKSPAFGRYSFLELYLEVGFGTTDRYRILAEAYALAAERAERGGEGGTASRFAYEAFLLAPDTPRIKALLDRLNAS